MLPPKTSVQTWKVPKIFLTSSFDTLQKQVLRLMGEISLVHGEVCAHRTLLLPRSLTCHPLNQLDQSHPAALGCSARVSLTPSTGFLQDEEVAIGSRRCLAHQAAGFSAQQMAVKHG